MNAPFPRAALACLAIAVCGAAPALACPTAADVTRGAEIALTFRGGEVVRYRQLDADLIGEIMTVDDSGGGRWAARYGGVYMVADAQLEDGEPSRDGLRTYRPADGARAWPRIAPGAVWAGDISTRDASGEAPAAFSYEMQIIQSFPVDIGGCVYNSLLIRSTETTGTGQTEYEQTFLTDLGLSYISSTTGADAAEFVPVRITAQ